MLRKARANPKLRGFLQATAPNTLIDGDWAKVEAALNVAAQHEHDRPPK